MSGGIGFGLRVNENVKAGEFVIEYVGEVIPASMLAERRAKYEALSHNYLMNLGDGWMIDATAMANVARFANHSCAPNCALEKWIVDGKQRNGLFAIRDIGEGEEITYSYNYIDEGPMAQPCLCGAEQCSGFVGVPPKKGAVAVAPSPRKITLSESPVKQRRAASKPSKSLVKQPALSESPVKQRRAASKPSESPVKQPALSESPVKQRRAASKPSESLVKQRRAASKPSESPVKQPGAAVLSESPVKQRRAASALSETPIPAAVPKSRRKSLKLKQPEAVVAQRKSLKLLMPPPQAPVVSKSENKGGHALRSRRRL